MAIQEKLSTGKGKFTPQYPGLGTGPVSYEDCVSEEFFVAEREAVFRRSWLKVGRIDQLRKTGSYFTRELPGLGSIVVVRQPDGSVKALHNVCAHRGNKVVWQEHPGEESQGTCRAFTCKYHGWRYGLDGQANHITNQEQFFDLEQYSLRMPELHCDVWAGFIFVNFAEHAEPLRAFLGERFAALDGYPFEKMTQRYGYRTRVKGNWKLSIDTILEWYHPPYVHGRFINPDVAKAEKMVPPPDAYHYDLFTSHMLNSVPGPPPMPPRKSGELGPAQRDQRWIYKLFRAGLFGPEDIPDVGELPDTLNPGQIQAWGNDAYWLFPNFSVQIWARNYYITYQYWPESVDSHIYELDMYFVPPRSAAERLAQELAADTTIEFAMQDCNTVEATHSALATRANNQFHLSDQELMIRNFHKVIRDTVSANQTLNAEEGS
ncbi:(2Fe-2S)-binding protein [Mycobacterium colombiense]|uniref:aromatic ring-hydroxylating oxygenase subunit alpha n=1 Tax=Mycobacterium colombiense TaxID=339268 RepID=UPI0007EF1623|nr:aromatic ring-hydroxylating dioxygenase subunit alpha [Mycobacterium colombiense]OBK63208.1 (2Fe-2S)-binding protein [Mycobacterium colombiense]